jgi:aminoglycoside/choline kinase family phosphotransferase/dTDP-glucose pyrophosphorylase
MKALVLAAGLGTRLLPYTAHTPKALFPLAGTPVLARHIAHLEAAGCEAVAVNTHHLHAQVESFVRAARFRIPVQTRHEPRLLGTGGAIGNLRDFWDERPFLVVNADIHHAIDLRAVYAAHLAGGATAAATLVLVNDPEFNTVAVDADGGIHGFAASRADAAPGALTFTGIQVLSPVVLDYLPCGDPADSIAAFRAMLSDGLRLNALVTRQPWVDLGTPARYRRAARDACALAAWESAFGRPPRGSLGWEHLEGDGSDREWFRLRDPAGTLVMADHGLRGAECTEADAFAQIGTHLKARGAAVPAVRFADGFAGLVFVEDLGCIHLQAVVRSEADRRRVLAIYRSVIDALVHLAVAGARGFDPGWAWQSPRFDREVVLERECRYFQERFLHDYAGTVPAADLADEFGRLADGIVHHAVCGFLHRDVQSRNIMVKDARPYFIDFQGGRLGPVQYDLASLLIDPYVGLAEHEQAELYAHALDGFARVLPIEPEKFRRGYELCALSRNLQVLGAFAFLSLVRHKTQFETYIPVALDSLRAQLGSMHREFPNLKAAVEDAALRMAQRH